MKVNLLFELDLSRIVKQNFNLSALIVQERYPFRAYSLEKVAFSKGANTLVPREAGISSSSSLIPLANENSHTEEPASVFPFSIHVH